MSRRELIIEEIEGLRDALRSVQEAYAAAQGRFDRAVSKPVKDSNLATCARWNKADRAIRRAIARLNTQLGEANR